VSIKRHFIDTFLLYVDGIDMFDVNKKGKDIPELIVHMGRRQFLVAASAASTAALASKKLGGLIHPDNSYAAATASTTASSKCVVIYSTLTGNTEKAAKAIQKGLEQAVGRSDLKICVPIGLFSDLNDAER
jgi:hypothetical protein